MIDDHVRAGQEEVSVPIFAQSDNAEVKRMQGIALADLEYSRYNEDSHIRLARSEI